MANSQIKEMLDAHIGGFKHRVEFYSKIHARTRDELEGLLGILSTGLSLQDQNQVVQSLQILKHINQLYPNFVLKYFGEGYSFLQESIAKIDPTNFSLNRDIINIDSCELLELPFRNITCILNRIIEKVKILNRTYEGFYQRINCLFKKDIPVSTKRLLKDYKLDKPFSLDEMPVESFSKSIDKAEPASKKQRLVEANIAKIHEQMKEFFLKSTRNWEEEKTAFIKSLISYLIDYSILASCRDDCLKYLKIIEKNFPSILSENSELIKSAKIDLGNVPLVEFKPLSELSLSTKTFPDQLIAKFLVHYIENDQYFVSAKKVYEEKSVLEDNGFFSRLVEDGATDADAAEAAAFFN